MAFRIVAITTSAARTPFCAPGRMVSEGIFEVERRRLGTIAGRTGRETVSSFRHRRDVMQGYETGMIAAADTDGTLAGWRFSVAPMMDWTGFRGFL